MLSFSLVHPQAPYDYDELLAAVAPRPTLLVAPTGNRFASARAVAAAASRAQVAWQEADAAANFTFAAPDRPSDFRDHEVHDALQWVEDVVLATGRR